MFRADPLLGAAPAVPRGNGNRPLSAGALQQLLSLSGNRAAMMGGQPGQAINNYHLVMTNIAMENPLSMEVFMGQSSINGSFSMAMLNNHRV